MVETAGKPVAFDTPRLHIEAATPRHAPVHPPFFARNREHLARWAPPRGAQIETLAYWERQLEQVAAEFAQRRTAHFVAFERNACGPDLRGPAAHARNADERAAAAPLVARVNFSQIFRGPFQSCVLGFEIDREREGRGLMREALAACIDFVLREFRLHRVQAAHRLENERSARLLARLGFGRIGVARDYLYIDGAWRDHVLTALTNPDFDVSVFTLSAN